MMAIIDDVARRVAIAVDDKVLGIAADNALAAGVDGVADAMAIADKEAEDGVAALGA